MNNTMAIHTYLSTIDFKNKINKQAEQKENHGYREHFDSCQIGGMLGGWAKGVCFYVLCRASLSPNLVSLVDVVEQYFDVGWSEAVYQERWLWGLLGVAGQGQSLPAFCLRPSRMSYKGICRWLLLVLCLQVSRTGHAAYQGCLLLVQAQ